MIPDRAIIRSMYRDIVRGIVRLKCHNPTIDMKPDLPRNLQTELEKFQTDPSAYKKYLLSELQFLAKEEFLKQNKNNLMNLYRKLSRGEKLVNTLKSIRNLPSLSWNGLISLLVDHRMLHLYQSVWRQKFAENREEINQGILKDMPRELARKKSSELQRLKTHKVTAPFGTLSSGDRTKVYRKRVIESRSNTARIIKLHLKTLQLLGHIPNPFKLPYVPLSASFLPLDQPRQRYLIPGSAKTSVLKKAYDYQIIKTIMEPEVEYRLNEKHFLGSIEHIVNNRGPARIKIAVTQAGVMPASYLRQPQKHLKFMQMVAMDIKRLMRCARKKFIWNLTSQKSNVVSEPKYGEGYGVIGSRGHSYDEIMYPREYYQQLAVDEAIWEHVVFCQTMNEKPTVSNSQNALDTALDSWISPLNVASAAVDQEMDLFFNKYKAITKQLRVEREIVQNKSNAYHKVVVSNYLKLIKALEEKHVFMHSDLYNNDHTPQTRYDAELIVQDKILPKLRVGVAEREKPGKSLGHYLVAAGFKGFKMGQTFKKRLDITKH